MGKNLEEARSWLGDPAPTAITIGRLPAVGCSADAAVAVAHARELAEHPKYYAKHDGQECLITHEAYLAFRKLAAKDETPFY